MKLLYRLSITLVVGLVFAGIALCAAVSEARKKKAMGANYEGPLEDDL